MYIHCPLLYLPEYYYYYYHYFVSETREKKSARSPHACLLPHVRYKKKFICEYSVGGIKGCSTDNWTIKGNKTRTSKTKKCGNWKYRIVKIIELWGWVRAYTSSLVLTKDDTPDHAEDYKGHSISPFFVVGKDLWHIHLFHSFSLVETIHHGWHSAQFIVGLLPVRVDFEQLVTNIARLEEAIEWLRWLLSAISEDNIRGVAANLKTSRGIWKLYNCSFSRRKGCSNPRHINARGNRAMSGDRDS